LPAPARESPPTSAGPTNPSGAPPSRTSQLSAERIILDAARAAMAQGDPATAIDRLERHRRTFANPILEEEREAMWIQALAKEGHGDEARSRAAVFRRRWPESLFSAMVLGAVESAP
jgi:outer membrane protein assembly factor BamD (BamD/ComL family)